LGGGVVMARGSTGEKWCEILNVPAYVALNRPSKTIFQRPVGAAVGQVTYRPRLDEAGQSRRLRDA
jgi:hypothetical protein